RGSTTANSSPPSRATVSYSRIAPDSRRATLTPALFTGPLSDAQSNGVPVVAVDNPPAPRSHGKLVIGHDHYQLRQNVADEAIKRLPASAKGQIVLGTSEPGVPVLDLRAKGMRDEITKHLPNVTVVGPFDTKQDTVANYEAWQILVRTNPHALAFLGTGDADG